MAVVNSTPIRKRSSQQTASHILNKYPSWLVPACMQWLVLGTQSPARPHLDFVNITLRGAVPNHLPTLGSVSGFN